MGAARGQGKRNKKPELESPKENGRIFANGYDCVLQLKNAKMRRTEEGRGRRLVDGRLRTQRIEQVHAEACGCRITRRTTPEIHRNESINRMGSERRGRARAKIKNERIFLDAFDIRPKWMGACTIETGKCKYGEWQKGVSKMVDSVDVQGVGDRMEGKGKM